MHNCKATQKKIADLVFAELQPNDSRQLLAELEGCHECELEYRALSQALRITRETIASVQPAGNFWPAHRARLRARIESIPELGVIDRDSREPVTDRLTIFVRGLATTSLRVPVPVAAVFVALFGASIIFAMQYRRPLHVESQPTMAPTVETTIVEVPIVKEKLVTRVVYIARNPRRDLTAKAQRRRVNDRGVPSASERARTLNAPMTLVGFTPADDVKLTIIKGSYHDEK